MFPTVPYSPIRTDSHLNAELNKKRIAVSKKADRTAFCVWYIAAEPNRRRFRVRNSHDHVTTLSTAIPDAEISAVRVFAACCG